MESQKEIKKDDAVIEALFKAGAHFAYGRSRRHPSAKPFIFGSKNKVEIFDLEKTKSALEKAKEFIKKIASEKGQVLFVGGKSEAEETVRNGAISIDMPYVSGRWIGGTLTNFTEIRKRVSRLEDLLSQKEKGELGKYTKKERLLIDRDIEKLKRFFSGIVSLRSMPKVLFVIDPKREKIAVAEACQKGIPVVGLAGSDCDMKDVDYAIPANDASVSSIKFFVDEIVSAYKEGLRSLK